jgi:hypothetical protein
VMSRSFESENSSSYSSMPSSSGWMEEPLPFFELWRKRSIRKERESEAFSMVGEASEVFI